MITTFLVVILVVASVTILWSFMSMFLISTGESGESAFANFLSLLSPKEEENENLEEGEDLNVDLDGACLIYNCSDSDSLIDFQNNETYFYGSVTISNGTFSYSFFDNCTDNSTLDEYYYNLTSVIVYSTSCGNENSCVNGACAVQQLPECSDGLDNDIDSYIDYPADFGCQDINDNSEINDGTPECSDGTDNDLDTKIDQVDLGCPNRDDDMECEVTSYGTCHGCTPTACSGCTGTQTSNCGTTESCRRPATGCDGGRCQGGQCVRNPPPAP